MELLDREDCDREGAGVVVDGLRWFPRARPLKMLRIFRTCFGRPEEAMEEIRRVRVVLDYLAPDHAARSEEFLVSYAKGDRCEVLLCGLQEYVHGEILDPWGPLTRGHLGEMLGRLCPPAETDPGGPADDLIAVALDQAGRFVSRIRRMILEALHVPDLAGVGNLLLTAGGLIKLVDINNISRVSFESSIPLDDRGYPVCDKSIEALSLLEGRLLERPLDKSDPIYAHFLNPSRVWEVKAMERAFHLARKPELPPAH
jgi:hypothetical protein